MRIRKKITEPIKLFLIRRGDFNGLFEICHLFTNLGAGNYRPIAYQMNELEEVRSDYESRIGSLQNENGEMKEFFDKLSVPILKRSVKNVERQLRQFPPEARQFGDDSRLNFFEEVCVMLQEGSMDDYPFVEDAVYNCCESAYDRLTSEDKFILNHQSQEDEKGSVEIVNDAFFQYASNYESKRINEAFHARS